MKFDQTSNTRIKCHVIFFLKYGSKKEKIIIHKKERISPKSSQKDINLKKRKV